MKISSHETVELSCLFHGRWEVNNSGGLKRSSRTKRFNELQRIFRMVEEGLPLLIFETFELVFDPFFTEIQRDSLDLLAR